MKNKSGATLFELVDSILWELWDPIGVNDVPGARSEYSSYVPSIVRLLETGADCFKLSAHLESLERVNMGIQSSTNHRKRVARALLAAHQPRPTVQ